MATANKLAGALSPYLLQHRHNPVHWYPWGDEALNHARELDRPILLSIGYSACHWCHVMAHESFENEAIAERMNAGFVNIKVDREERPDLDRIYQLGHQLLTGRGGGWPLTVFLAPEDLTPFFAGTYFPARQRHGMIPFPELLARIEQAWRERRKELLEQNSRLRDALEQVQRMAPGTAPPDASLPERLLETLRGMFDAEYGGFGGGPKFPQAPFLEALAGPGLSAENATAREMLRHTLESMARSGLRDHLGGGFFRYCVDGRWEIPHFEKMLYDNAQLLPLYAEAAAAWQAPQLAEAAEELVAWLEREMLLPGGGFCASLDADNHEGEGAYYAWTPDEVTSVLGATPVGGPSRADPSGRATAPVKGFFAFGKTALDFPPALEDPPTGDRVIAWFLGRYGLDGPPNFENKHWHLVIRQSLATLADDEAETEPVERALRIARDALLEAREQRARPGRDDKVIAGWNGLMIAGLCRAGRALNRPEWSRMAESALRFVCDNLFGQTPPHAVWRDGESGHPATLDDHAALLLACLEVLRERFDPRWLEQARSLAGAIIEHFADPDHGGLYLTAVGQENLLTRPAASADDATPSGAGLAVLGLIRLGHLAAEPRYLDAAEKAITAAGADMERHPAAHPTLIRALAEWHHPLPQALIGGEEETAAMWQAALRTRFDCLTWSIPQGQNRLPAPLDRMAVPGPVRAVVCKGMVCLPEVDNLDALKQQIDEYQGPPQK